MRSHYPPPGGGTFSFYLLLFLLFFLLSLTQSSDQRHHHPLPSADVAPSPTCQLHDCASGVVATVPNFITVFTIGIILLRMTHETAWSLAQESQR